MDRIIIDVREPYEYATGHVDGALNIPPQELIAGAHQLADVPKDTQLVLYCHTGSRSAVAANFLRGFGYTNIVNGINKDHVTARYL